jgi:hypothetical protein
MDGINLGFDVFPTEEKNTLRAALANALSYNGDIALARTVYHSFDESNLVAKNGALQPLLSPALVSELTLGNYTAKFVTANPIEQLMEGMERDYGERVGDIRRLIEQAKERGELVLMGEGFADIDLPSIHFFSTEEGLCALTRLPPIEIQGDRYEEVYVGGSTLYMDLTEKLPISAYLSLERNEQNTIGWLIGAQTGET